ncbi:unnamed protein product [Fraxinus pennsylvanica]|uniref:Reverse transcriptase domain-containing protein n=1 Tax=Fraxinus pennsylvanica TaxID=56036 RepID=A0AAD1ZKG7_9LAMI|nr:unnamed protein product [Fraxinus pennsylvanica]
MFSDCELRNLGFKGPQYTWHKGRHKSTQIFERLDRFTANTPWCQLFTYDELGEKACSDIVLNQWSGYNPQILEDPLHIKSDVLQNTADEVQTWMDRKELMWKQRSRATWLEGGDQNTRFFHAKASQRRKTNMITKLLDDQGCWQEGDACNSLIINYYSDLFSSNGLYNQNVVVDKMERKALKEMHPAKAPGPDGMPPLFFQKFWPHIGSSISNAVLHALNTCEFPQELNHTFMTLIPKTENPQKVKDFRPISVSFIKGRLITDNVLVAYEMLHYLRRRLKGKKGFMSLKLDMSKAPTGHIVPSRGLRQGDPISPYLFLLCTEGLISLMNEAESTSRLTSIQVCQRAPRVNHLLFADDSLIFYEAKEETMSRL